MCPEITEVEKLRKQLQPAWIGKRVTRFSVPSRGWRIDPRKYAQMPWKEFSQTVKGVEIEGIDRLGKNLWVKLATKPASAWHIHLYSTGWFLPGNPTAITQARIDPIHQNFLHKVDEKTLHMKITFDDGQVWEYHDQRTWGKWYLKEGSRPRDHEYFLSYGPDWLDEPREAEEVIWEIKTRRKLKDVLTDQKVTAGLGNYLACEACWKAKLHPHRRKHNLTGKELKRLTEKIRELLQECLISPDHSHWGIFQKRNCGRCGAPTKYSKDGGSVRGSYFCGTCQPLESTDFL